MQSRERLFRQKKKGEDAYSAGEDAEVRGRKRGAQEEAREKK